MTRIIFIHCEYNAVSREIDETFTHTLLHIPWRVQLILCVQKPRDKSYIHIYTYVHIYTRF